MNDVILETIEQAVRLLDQGQVSDAHQVLNTLLATPEEVACEPSEAVNTPEEA